MVHPFASHPQGKLCPYSAQQGNIEAASPVQGNAMANGIAAVIQVFLKKIGIDNLEVCIHFGGAACILCPHQHENQENIQKGSTILAVIRVGARVDFYPIVLLIADNVEKPYQAVS